MSPRAVRAFGPGRVNVVGEHTDYNGGRCLPFALHLGVTVSARKLPEREVRAHAEDLTEADAFALDEPGRATGWRAYVRGTAAELQSAGWRLVALAGHDDVDRHRLVPVCSRVENEWVGARTGQLDQSASLLCRPGHALLLDFADGLHAEDVALPQPGWSFVVADSGQPHSNAASEGYNTRRAECARACELLGVRVLSEAPSGRLEGLPPALRRRAEHVLGENARLRIAGARPRRELLTGPGSLTAAERRVADAAAAGSSNREIAQSLFVSPKTVEMHLGRVYRKLDVGSRRDLPGVLGDRLATAA